MFQDISHRFQPSVQSGFVADALVGPVRGQAAFGSLIHPLGPDLHLDIGPVPVPYRNVQGLIAVWLRKGEPVPEPVGVLLVFFSHIAEYLPAESLFSVRVWRAVNYEPDGKNIIDSFERHLLLAHLVVDGPGCLGPDFQLVLDTFVRKLLLERLNELNHQFLTVLFCGFELVGDGPVLLRVGIAEIYVLHLALHIVETELVGEWYIEEKGLEVLPFAGRLREHSEVAHNFQTVSQFDDRHPRVPGVGNYELLVVFSFEPGVLGLDGCNLVQPFDHCCNIPRKAAQVLFHFIEASCLVQKYRSHTFCLKSDFVADYLCDIEGVLEKRVPILPHAVLQLFFSDAHCPVYQRFTFIAVFSEIFVNLVHRL